MGRRPQNPSLCLVHESALCRRALPVPRRRRDACRPSIRQVEARVVAMTVGPIIPWLVAGIPLLGALLCLALWSNPGRLKVSAFLVSIASLGANAGLSGLLPTLPEGPLPFYLLPIAAGVSLLG